MAYAQSLAQSSSDFEIQHFKDALAASQKQADQYAHLIASLYYELDNIRKNICDSCKKKLAINTSVAISADQGSAGSATSVPVLQGPQHSSPTTDNAPLAPPQDANPTSSPVSSESEVANYHSPSQSTATPINPGPNEEIESFEQKWSVVYHPEVERALDLHLAHTFTYDSALDCVKMSPDGQRLAVGGDGKTYLNELETGSNICVFVDRYVRDSIGIWSVQFSPDGQLLATGASDDRIRIWDITIKRMRAMFNGHKSEVNSIAFAPNGRSLVSASDDRSVRIWNIRDGSSKVLPVTGSPGYFNSVAFSPDGRYVAAGNMDSSLCMWDSRTHKLVAKWQGHTSDVGSTEFTPDGKGLMSGGSDNTVKYWDVSLLGNRQGSSTGTVVNDEQGFREVRSFLGHDGGVHSTALFPENTQWVVTGSHDHSVRVWDTRSGVCHLTMQGHFDWVSGVDVSQRQNFLATAGDDGHVTVWKYTLL